MNIESLNWYRNNINYTFNSISSGNLPIEYPDTLNPGAKYKYLDEVKTPLGLRFYGTPGEFSARNKTSKDISVVSGPTKGRNYYTNYPSNPTLTSIEAFPGNKNNQQGLSSSSPFHVINLNFPGRDSLRLNNNKGTNGYKSWS